MTLYEEMIKIPLFIVTPDRQDRVVDTPVSLVDILPTVLSECGIESPSAIRGQNLLADSIDERTVIAHATCPGDPAAYYEDESSYLLGSARKGSYKFILSGKNEDELYDLGTDPKENENVANRLSEVASELRQEVILSIDDKSPSHHTGTERREVEKQLEKLGYK